MTSLKSPPPQSARLHLDEPLAVAGGAADVGIEHGVAARDEQLSPRLEGVGPAPGGSAVDEDDERQPGPGVAAVCRAAGKEKRAFDLGAVEALVVDELRRDHANRRPGRVERGGGLRRCVRRLDPDFRRLGGRLTHIRDRAVRGARERRRVDAKAVEAMRPAVEAERDEGAREATLLGRHQRAPVDPLRARQRPIDRRACEVARGAAARRLQPQVVRLGAVDSASDVGDRRAVGRDREAAEGSARRGDLAELSIRDGDGVDAVRVLVRCGRGGGRRDDAVAGGQPFELVDLPGAAGHLAQGVRRHVHDPQAREAIVLVDDARIVFFLLALVEGVGLRLRHEQRDLPAVWRPAERPDGFLAVHETGALAAVERQEVEAGRAVAIRDERQRAAVRRPARARLGLVGVRQLADVSGRDVEHPDMARPRRPFRRLGDGEREARAVRGEFEIADRAPIERLLRRERGSGRLPGGGRGRQDRRGGQDRRHEHDSLHGCHAPRRLTLA